MKCLCESGMSFEACCEPFLTGAKKPDTAEKLMRSRYTAYARGEINYIKNTLAPEAQKGFDMAGAKKWAKESQWKGLKILKTDKGGPADKKGTVEFMAKYTLNGETVDHHEVAQFRKNNDGHWLFVDGDAHTHKEGEDHDHHHHAKVETIVRAEPKLGRNDPCSCGSGKKFKKCCGA